MSEDIVPLRQKGGERSALARVDIAAAKVLTDGRATSLNAARAAVILTELYEQRDQMITVLADLRGRAPTGDPRIDEVNADLITAIGRGLTKIELFAEQARVRAEEAAQTR